MIICSGEALIDMLPRRLAGGEEAFVPVPGGAVFNTAVALGRLGEDTGFFSGISTDMFGRKLIAQLQQSGIDTAFCVRSPRPTTLAFVELVGGNASYHFVDENTAGRMLGSDALPAFPDTVQAVHFGAISLIPEPCGSTYEELMRRICGRAVISLDPNIRPGFVHDENAYRRRLRRMIAMSDIVKVSDEDLAWLAPGESFTAVAESWLTAGVSIVTLTLGDKGARAVTHAGDVTTPGRAVEVVDTVGAGDSFNAGFLAKLRESGVLTKSRLRTITDDAVKAALEFATGVAAHVVGKAGANPPWRHELSGDEDVRRGSPE